MQKPEDSFLSRMNGKIQKGIKLVLAVLVAAFMTITFAQTVLRYCFHGSIWWSEELSRYLFIWSIMLGVNVAIMDNQMLRLEFVDSLLGKRAAAMVDIIVSVIGWLLIASLLYSSVIYFQALGTKQLAPTLGWQMRYVTLCMPIGAGLSLWAQTLTLIKKTNLLIKDFREKKDKEVTI